MFSSITRKRVYRLLPITILAVSLSGGAGVGASSSSQASKFADPAFERVWQRTDLPVARGDVTRTWFWGPTPGAGLQEGYQQTPGGAFARHMVQYFDKARMEINDRSMAPSNPWYVTNGLLTVELIAGEPTTGGPTSNAPREAADIPLASDLNDANAPTYRSFRAVADVPGNDGHQVNSALGKAATATINRAGQVGSDPSKASIGNAVKYAYYEPTTHHNVVAVFWDFLNSTGLVYENGQTRLRLLSQPWFYATGYPISEAYWAKASIAGQPHDVLIQAFQRRVLTYVPDNPAGWQVQMGNIGLHYYQWRYEGPVPVPTASPTSKPVGRIAFVSDRTGGGGLGIFTMAPDGSDARQVARTAGSNYSPRYAPNGQSIVYVNAPPNAAPVGGPGGIALLSGSAIMFTSDAQGSVGAPMGATSVPKWEAQADPAYSPDGLFLVFKGKPLGDKPGLFIANIASEAIVIPIRRLTSGEWDQQPVWSPDGKQIAYTSSDMTLGETGAGAPNNSQIWVINADGSGNHRLTKALGGQIDENPAWSPDGKKVIYNAINKGTGANRAHIMSVLLDGTPGPKFPGDDNSNQRYPCYSPDGYWITFSSDKSGNDDIYISPADGSKWTDITNSPSMDSQPNWGK